MGRTKGEREEEDEDWRKMGDVKREGKRNMRREEKGKHGTRGG